MVYLLFLFFKSDHSIRLKIVSLKVLENLLEISEQKLVKENEIPSLYNVSIPTQVRTFFCFEINWVHSIRFVSIDRKMYGFADEFTASTLEVES